MKIQSLLNYEGQNSEIIAVYILKELGYKIIFSQALEDRKYLINKTSSFRWKDIRKKYPQIQTTIAGIPNGDIICKIKEKYFIFEVKLKIYQDNKKMNTFTVTNNEIVNYTKLTKLGKISVKVLINLKKDDGHYYGIFDWNDFTYSKNFDPKKTKSTSLRLTNGLDISKLTKFTNKKRYKFEKYLEYSHIPKIKEDNQISNLQNSMKNVIKIQKQIENDIKNPYVHKKQN